MRSILEAWHIGSSTYARPAVSASDFLCSTVATGVGCAIMRYERGVRLYPARTNPRTPPATLTILLFLSSGLHRHVYFSTFASTSAASAPRLSLCAGSINSGLSPLCTSRTTPLFFSISFSPGLLSFSPHSPPSSRSIAFFSTPVASRRSLPGSTLGSFLRKCGQRPMARLIPSHHDSVDASYKCDCVSV